MKRIASLIIGIMMFSLVCLGQALRTPDAYYYRGLARQEKGDLDGAIADFNEAIKLYPKYSSAYGSRGAARKAKGDLEGAVADYNRAIEIDPNLALPYYYRGFVFLENQDFDNAIKDFDKALEIQPNLAIVVQNRADAKRGKGDLPRRRA